MVIEGNVISGATVDRIPLEKFPSFPAALPILTVQRKVADILSAYDDLIENNRRRMVLLEEAARQLYREWFVRLRFPGHEHTCIIDSPLGPIAEGWRVVRLGDITTKIGSGATPRGGQAAYQEKGITLIRSLNVYDEHFEDDGLAFINDDQAAQLSHVSVEPRDILLNITGASVARCCMVPERHLPARVNQHVMIIRIDTTLVDPSFVLCAINSDQRKRQLLSYAQVGATREALTKETITNFEIVLPDEKLLHQFSEVARDVNQQREVLTHQNADLRAARDLLLPRLMSGEIAV
jgi:type I restriction enzyme S subunit